MFLSVISMISKQKTRARWLCSSPEIALEHFNLLSVENINSVSMKKMV